MMGGIPLGQKRVRQEGNPRKQLAKFEGKSYNVTIQRRWQYVREILKEGARLIYHPCTVEFCQLIIWKH